MKNIILTSITLLSFTFSNSQEIKKVVKNDYKIGPFEISDDRNDPERSQYWAFYASFQNEKYTSITDIESIVFESFETFQKFATLMQDMIDMPDEELVVDSGFSSSFSYRLNKYDFSKNSIYIYNKDGAFTMLNKKHIADLNKLIQSLE